MGGIAFYAPLKPPDHPVPSGERTVARALMAALDQAGVGGVRLLSRLRSRDGHGDTGMQTELFAAAEAERDRLRSLEPPDAWVTYHSYYKAPDLLGPALSRHWGIPYVLVEATRAAKRLSGPWARFAAAAEDAADVADVIFYFTAHDRIALEDKRPEHQKLVHLSPFLNVAELPPEVNRRPAPHVKMLCCAMFRDGDKMRSYEALADALHQLETTAWTLAVAGDGPMRDAVAELFEPFGDRVDLLGALEPSALGRLYGASDLLVWPGVGEAFGMVYLEAQAHGCPVLAEDRPGVRDVVRDGGLLVPPADPAAFARAVERFVRDPTLRKIIGDKGRAQIAADHLLPTASATLALTLTRLTQRPGP